jgi:hypothetical protein
MYRLRRREISIELKYALVMRARFNRLYIYKMDRVKTYLKDDEV